MSPRVRAGCPARSLPAAAPAADLAADLAADAACPACPGPAAQSAGPAASWSEGRPWAASACPAHGAGRASSAAGPRAVSQVGPRAASRAGSGGRAQSGPAARPPVGWGASAEPGASGAAEASACDPRAAAPVGASGGTEAWRVPEPHGLPEPEEPLSARAARARRAGSRVPDVHGQRAELRASDAPAPPERPVRDVRARQAPGAVRAVHGLRAGHRLHRHADPLRRRHRREALPRRAAPAPSVRTLRRGGSVPAQARPG